MEEEQRAADDDAGAHAVPEEPQDGPAQRNGPEQDEEPPQQPDHLRLQDLEGWLLANGLRAAPPAAAAAAAAIPNQQQQQPHPQQQPQQDQDQPNQGANLAIEEQARLDAEENYTRRIHQQVFGAKIQQEEQKQRERRQFLATLEGWTIDLHTADKGIVAGLPLRRLAEHCDTLYKLAETWDNFSHEENNPQQQRQQSQRMSFSLDIYPRASVREFVSALLREEAEEENEATTNTNTRTAAVQDISPSALVDCCLMAHYLCADRMLKDITDVLVQSIDTSNCLSLCRLADQLNLPVLFERSLAHMMQTIGDLESTDTWEDLTPELRDRIAAIKSAIESSVNDSQSRVYFASLDEYLAIFAERVQYFRERLAEAKEQQQQQSGTHGTRAWFDAQTKIERQEERVRTLEIAFREHKQMFTSKRLRTD